MEKTKQIHITDLTENCPECGQDWEFGCSSKVDLNGKVTIQCAKCTKEFSYQINPPPGISKKTDNKMEIEYLLGGWNPQKWEGTVKEAIQIALAEIHEHAGGSSPAYIFTKKIFDELG